MTPVLVVGSVAFDTLHLPCGYYPKVAGGAALYAAVSGALFAPIRLVGVVGADFPPSFLELLTNRRIDLSGLEQRMGKTFHWAGRYSTNLASRETLSTELNVFADFAPVLPESFKDSEFILLGNIDPVLQLAVLEQIRKPKLVVADTMNYWIQGALPALRRTLQRVDVLVINEEEARELACTYNLVESARIMQTMGPKTVIIKRGEYGALLFHDGEVFSAPAYPLKEVRDPTGAGDSFAGALLGWIASCGSFDASVLRQAVIYGSAVASFDVEGVGPARLLHLSFNDIQHRYSEFRRLVAFADDAVPSPASYAALG
ncbi:MAG: sugar kinase [Myxococcales bacterium]|nr:sugar kinase [Myxococcales bacterium]